jgi:hypothetical protein
MPEATQSPSATTTTGIERRRSHREPVLTAGTIVSTTAGIPSNPRQVMVTDVSLHGVGFRITEHLMRDTVFKIEIGVGPLYLRSKFRVVRIRQRADGTYDVGGEFC